MVGKTKLLEKESAAFANEKPPVCISHSALSQKAVITDELLENTLLNVKLDESLTKREVEILKLIVVGNTNKKIAQKICRTERTVEYHRHRLMRKLGAHCAADLVKRAIAIGIV
jgi:DNA-binding NarL/FixJ family response regulator